MSSTLFSRRNFFKISAALTGYYALGSMPNLANAGSHGLTVGFIYVGPKDDFGYNQAHAEGAAAVKLMKGVSVVEEENVAETVDVQKTMESIINFDGEKSWIIYRDEDGNEEMEEWEDE